MHGCELTYWKQISGVYFCTREILSGVGAAHAVKTSEGGGEIVLGRGRGAKQFQSIL